MAADLNEPFVDYDELVNDPQFNQSSPEQKVAAIDKWTAYAREYKTAEAAQSDDPVYKEEFTKSVLPNFEKGVAEERDYWARSRPDGVAGVVDDIAHVASKVAGAASELGHGLLEVPGRAIETAPQILPSLFTNAGNFANKIEGDPNRRSIFHDVAELLRVEDPTILAAMKQGKDTADYWKNLREQNRSFFQPSQQSNESGVARIAGMVADSVPATLLPLAVAVGTKSPTTMFALIGAQSAVPAYGDAVDAGKTSEEALGYAAAQAGAEVGGAGIGAKLAETLGGVVIRSIQSRATSEAAGKAAASIAGAGADKTARAAVDIAAESGKVSASYLRELASTRTLKGIGQEIVEEELTTVAQWIAEQTFDVNDGGRAWYENFNELGSRMGDTALLAGVMSVGLRPTLASARGKVVEKAKANLTRYAKEVVEGKSKDIAQMDEAISAGGEEAGLATWRKQYIEDRAHFVLSEFRDPDADAGRAKRFAATHLHAAELKAKAEGISTETAQRMKTAESAEASGFVETAKKLWEKATLRRSEAVAAFSEEAGVNEVLIQFGDPESVYLPLEEKKKISADLLARLGNEEVNPNESQTSNAGAAGSQGAEGIVPQSEGAVSGAESSQGQPEVTNLPESEVIKEGVEGPPSEGSSAPALSGEAPTAPALSVPEAVERKAKVRYDGKEGFLVRNEETGRVEFRPQREQIRYELRAKEGADINGAVSDLEGVELVSRGQSRKPKREPDTQPDVPPETAELIAAEPDTTPVPETVAALEADPEIHDIYDQVTTPGATLAPEAIESARQKIDRAVNEIADDVNLSEEQRDQLAEPWLQLNEDLDNYERSRQTQAPEIPNASQTQPVEPRSEETVAPGAEAGVAPTPVVENTPTEGIVDPQLDALFDEDGIEPGVLEDAERDASLPPIRTPAQSWADSTAAAIAERLGIPVEQSQERYRDRLVKLYNGAQAQIESAGLSDLVLDEALQGGGRIKNSIVGDLLANSDKNGDPFLVGPKTQYSAVGRVKDRVKQGIIERNRKVSFDAAENVLPDEPAEGVLDEPLNELPEPEAPAASSSSPLEQSQHQAIREGVVQSVQEVVDLVIAGEFPGVEGSRDAAEKAVWQIVGDGLRQAAGVTDTSDLDWVPAYPAGGRPSNTLKQLSAHKAEIMSAVMRGARERLAQIYNPNALQSALRTTAMQRLVATLTAETEAELNRATLDEAVAEARAGRPEKLTAFIGRQLNAPENRIHLQAVMNKGGLLTDPTNGGAVDFDAAMYFALAPAEDSAGFPAQLRGALEALREFYGVNPLAALSQKGANPGIRLMAEALRAVNPGAALTLHLNWAINGLAQGGYVPSTGNPNIHVDPSLPAAEQQRTILHESTHRLTADLLNKFLSGNWEGLTDEQLQAASNLQTLMHEAVAAFKETYPNPTWEQARVFGYLLRNDKTSLLEFVAEVFGNKEFQDFLAGIQSDVPSQPGSLWSRFIGHLTKLLFPGRNVAPGSVFAGAVENTLRLAQNSTVMTRGQMRNDLRAQSDWILAQTGVPLDTLLEQNPALYADLAARWRETHPRASGDTSLAWQVNELDRLSNAELEMVVETAPELRNGVPTDAVLASPLRSPAPLKPTFEEVADLMPIDAPLQGELVNTPPDATDKHKAWLQRAIAEAGTAFNKIFGKTITAVDGRKVKIQRAGETLLETFRHITKNNQTGYYNPQKIRSVPAIERTLREATVRLVDVEAGDQVFLYVRRIAKDEWHTVVVRADGSIKDQTSSYAPGSLATQFVMGRPDRRWSLPVDGEAKGLALWRIDTPLNQTDSELSPRNLDTSGGENVQINFKSNELDPTGSNLNENGQRTESRNRYEQDLRDALGRWMAGGGTVSYQGGIGQGLEGSGQTAFRSDLTAEEFSQIAEANRASHKFGTSVDVYPSESYAGYSLIIARRNGETATASISPSGEVGAVTKSPGATREDVDAAFAAAIATGRVKWLNGFDTVLPRIYAKLGFEAVARIKFNDEYKPEGWDYQAYSKYNNGRPDVVFMRYTGNPHEYAEGPKGQLVEDYDSAAQLAQQPSALKSSNKIAPRLSNATLNGPSPKLFFKNENGTQALQRSGADGRGHLLGSVSFLEGDDRGGHESPSGPGGTGLPEASGGRAEWARVGQLTASRLRAFAEDNGLILQPALFKTTVFKGRKEIGDGSEHTVYGDPATERVIKITHADDFGDGVVGQSLNVRDYLRGLQLQNTVFGDDIRLEGIVQLEGELPQVVISQPFVKGRAATPTEISAFLRSKGFARQEDGSWLNSQLGVRASDTVGKNILAVERDGKTLVVPIDVQLVSEPQPKALASGVKTGFQPTTFGPDQRAESSAMARAKSANPDIAKALENHTYFRWAESESQNQANAYIDDFLASGRDLSGVTATADNDPRLPQEQATLIRPMALKRVRAAIAALDAKIAQNPTDAPGLMLLRRNYEDTANTLAREIADRASAAGSALRVFRTIADVFAPKDYANLYKDPIQRTQVKKMERNPFVRALRAAVNEANRAARVGTVEQMRKVLTAAGRRYLPPDVTPDEARWAEDFAHLFGSPLPIREQITRAATESAAAQAVTNIRRSLGTTPDPQFLDQITQTVRTEAANQINSLINERLAGGRVDDSPVDLTEAQQEERLRDVWRELGTLDIAEMVFDRSVASIVTNLPQYAGLLKGANFDAKRSAAIRRAVTESVSIADEIRRTVSDRNLTAQVLAARVRALNPEITQTQADKLAAAVEGTYNALVQEHAQKTLSRIVAQADTPKKDKETNRNMLSELLPLINMGAFSEERFYNAIAPKFNLPAWDPATVERISKEATALQSLPEDSLQRDEATQRISQSILKAQMAAAGGAKNLKNLTEVTSSLWTAGVLSGPPTHQVNFVSTMASVFLESMAQATGNYVAARRGGTDHKAAQKFFGDAFRAWQFAFGKGADKTTRRALSEAYAAWNKGTTRFKSEKGEALHLLELFDFDPNLASLKNYPATLKYVGRAMLAADGVNSLAAASAKQIMAARALALQEGLTPEQLDARIKDLLNPSDELIAKVTPIVEAEDALGNFGAPGTRSHRIEKSRRLEQLIEQESYSPEILEKGRDFAAYASFNGDAYGLVGAVMEGTFGFLNRLSPAFKPLNPFVRTVSNLVNASINWTPYGFARAENFSVLRAIGGSEGPAKRWLAEELERGSSDYYAMQARASAGTTALLLVMALGAYILKAWDDGEGEDLWVDLTGAGPDDFKQRQQWLNAGNKQYSLRLGNRWFRYTDWPALSLMLGVSATVLDKMKWKNTEQGLGLSMVYAARAAVSVTLDRNMLSGVSGLFDALASGGDDATAMRALGRFSGSYVGGITNPQIIRWLGRTTTGEIKEQSSLQGWALSMTPVGSFVGRPKYNILGEVIEVPPMDVVFSRFTMAHEAHPILTPLTDRGLFLTPPQGYRIVDPTTGNPRPLTQLEKYDFGKLYGDTLNANLQRPGVLDNIFRLYERNPQLAQDTLNSLATRSRNAAQREMGLRKAKGR